MKALIGILMVVVVAMGGYKIWEHWKEVEEQRFVQRKSAGGGDINPEQLPGLPYQLEPKLREAQRGGAVVLKRFIDACRLYPDVKDPRLAWMELDYVVLISNSDPVEAKKIFWQVKKRTSTNSVIYPRIQSLAKTYE